MKLQVSLKDKYNMQSNDDDAGAALAGELDESNDNDDTKPPGN